MFSKLPLSQKVMSIFLASAVSAIVFSIIFGINFTQKYTDFIVGNITWEAKNKLQDLIVLPICIIFFICSFSWITNQFNKLNEKNYSDELMFQLMLWLIPILLTFSLFFSGYDLKLSILLITALGFVCHIMVINNFSLKIQLDLTQVGYFFFSIVLLALIPLELCLLVNKIAILMNSEINLSYNPKSIYWYLSIGFIIGLIAWNRYPKTVLSCLAPSLLIGQLSLSVLFLALYPARLLQPDGALLEYQITPLLKYLIACLIIASFIDTLQRYIKYPHAQLSKIISPIAIFALLIGLKFGNTSPPMLPTDDYHFGEQLLGWWLYLQGSIPYIDYVPAHGLIDDDLKGFISHFFYNGSASSVWGEASRVGTAFLAATAFFAFYRFTKSLSIAFVLILVLEGRMTWLFFIPFLCLWFNPQLIQKPSKWLGVWLLTVPIIILGTPPQGILLVASSSFMMLFILTQFIKTKNKDWKYIIGAIVTLLILSITSPFLNMLLGAIRYVLINGSINQVAYGIFWPFSWDPQNTNFLLEFKRMSWVIVVIIIITISYETLKNDKLKFKNILPAITTTLFILLLIPYSMGRIDPNSLSRAGVISMMCWLILYPLACWHLCTKINILLITGIGMILFSNYSFNSFPHISTSTIRTDQLIDAKKYDLPNIGTANINDVDWWYRLVKLNTLLNKKLSKQESYLDLSSRNAHYFYFGRSPLISVTAPYNLVSRNQQIREILKLSKNPPKIALLEAANVNMDGGGLALRTPFLYEFIIENYIPNLEKGFIIGYEKQALKSFDPLKADITIQNITDVNWDHGIKKDESSILVEKNDLQLLDFFQIGQAIELNGEKRVVTDIVKESNRINFSGSVIHPKTNDDNELSIEIPQELLPEYRARLFTKAFSTNDLRKIPVAWGKSEKTLVRVLTLIQEIDKLKTETQELESQTNGYKILGGDPQIHFDLSKLNLSGRDADILRLSFLCNSDSVQVAPKIQIFWSGDGNGFSESASIRLTAENGVILVPLYSAYRWRIMNKITNIRIDFEETVPCKNVNATHISLYKRL